MIQKMFTIYDEKAQAYLPPFFLHADGMAMRTFADCVNSNDHQFGKHPQDYTLFTIGEFDDALGGLVVFDHRKMLGNGVEFIKAPQIELADVHRKQETLIGDEAPIQRSSEGGNSS